MSDSSAPASTDVLSRWAPALAAVAVVLVYGRSLGNGFAWDDAYLIVENESVHSFRHLKDWFFLPWAAGSESEVGRAQNALYWRPITQASFALDWLWGGGKPWAFHATNMGLHALNSVLVARIAGAWATALRPGRGYVGWAMLAAGLIWAVHPVHGEAVNLATYRSTLLSGFGVLLAVSRFCSLGGRIDWIVVLGYAIGVCSKEDAAVGIGLLGICALALAPKSLLNPRRWLGWAALVAVAGGWWFARAQITSAPVLDFLAGASTADAARTLLKVYLLDVRLLLVPWPLTPFYDWSIFPVATTWADSEVLAGMLLVVLTLGGLLWGVWRRVRTLLLLLGFFVIALVPYSHILPFFDIAGERFLYVPSVAFCAGAGLLVQAAWAKSERAVVWVAILGLATTAGAWSSFARVVHFDSTESLVRETARLYPHSFSAQFELGRMALERRDFEEAIDHFRAAHEIMPSIGAATLLLARALSESGQADAARELATHEAERFRRAGDPQQAQLFADWLRTQE